MENHRYKLFEHMSNEHGLTLLDYEMDEIISIVEKISNKECQNFNNIIPKNHNIMTIKQKNNMIKSSIILGIYVVFSFIGFSFNPYDWGFVLRFLFIVISLFSIMLKED